jgi:hypothetical protein
MTMRRSGATMPPTNAELRTVFFPMLPFPASFSSPLRFRFAAIFARRKATSTPFGPRPVSNLDLSRSKSLSPRFGAMGRKPRLGHLIGAMKVHHPIGRHLRVLVGIIVDEILAADRAL